MVRMRSAVRIRPAAPKSIENFGFRCFFAVKMLKTVRVKMWVNRLAHTLTHTRKCAERAKDERTEKPLFWKAFSLFRRVLAFQGKMC